MSKVDYKVLEKFLDFDELDLKFDKVVNDIRDVDIDYGVDIIFQYYRRHGFPHYKIREEEKHEHM